MRVLWDSRAPLGPPIGAIHAKLPDCQLSTIQTVLRRLMRKRAVSRRRSSQGAYWRYTATIGRDAQRMLALDALVAQHFEGDPAELKRFLHGLQ